MSQMLLLVRWILPSLLFPGEAIWRGSRCADSTAPCANHPGPSSPTPRRSPKQKKSGKKAEWSNKCFTNFYLFNRKHFDQDALKNYSFVRGQVTWTNIGHFFKAWIYLITFFFSDKKISLHTKINAPLMCTFYCSSTMHFLCNILSLLILLHYPHFIESNCLYNVKKHLLFFCIPV